MIFKFDISFGFFHSVITLSFFSVLFFLLFEISKKIQESDGEKSDQDLVVDVANEMVSIISLTRNTKKQNITVKHPQLTDSKHTPKYT